MFFKKEKAIIKKIEDYIRHITVCRDHFFKCIELFISQPLFDPQDGLVEAVHRLESIADDIRRDIEYELYNKALVPESREDIFSLIEALDDIPDCFQHLCYDFSAEKILVPACIKSDLLEFARKNLETVDHLQKTFPGFFYRKDIFNELRRIDELESEVDKMQRALISRVFELSIDKADKLVLKHVIEKIASLSDLAQGVADRLAIASIKRRI